MTISNLLQKKNRSQRLDLGGNLFIKGKLHFRFIREWVLKYNEDVVKVQKKSVLIF